MKLANCKLCKITVAFVQLRGTTIHIPIFCSSIKATVGLCDVEHFLPFKQTLKLFNNSPEPKNKQGK